MLAEAWAHLNEALRHMEELDEIGADLHRLGYWQFPRFDFITGYRPSSDEIVTVEENADFILDIADEPPAPQAPGDAECDKRRETLTPKDIREGVRYYEKTRRSIAKKRRDGIGEAAGWLCYYCGCGGSSEKGPDSRLWHIDHSYPFVLGGDDDLDNLVLACATCNLEKHAMSALEYLRLKLADQRKKEHSMNCEQPV